ncbi:6-phosphofructokinase [Saccharicrinis fermentans]|uniref:Pyrophosphate-fructose 6-phosphate 1-phosphotransferase n=1 Tax=Saccharicrinis fermentans DSM 9555 = JCM 21142 TaxID=869213 RepID=W7YD26_9BACT|nr:ATP-dependent 6-phosphofructokinase [Saccharicrinis fermentans]GAF02366.1 pyrophosphate-fructose 6-phosphate 1-phosphotransferase [Saccharicrinis fermentans DSM 9555 = JCM 21142]
MNKNKLTIGILTGGGDVPGLNPAIRAVTLRAIREGYKVIGIKNGWKGAISIDRSKSVEEQTYCIPLTELTVNKIGRTGGTFLHSSRTKATKVALNEVPEHLKSIYKDEFNDLTNEAVANLKHIGIDYLIPIGGDDTLSYAVRLHQEGIKVVGIPKTMDGDVPGTEYCIGFSTCVTRTIELTHELRTCAGSHERFLVLEVFGRNAGFSALLPTIGGAADRCVIPEYSINTEKLTALMVEDRRNNPSNYSVVLVSEGASFDGSEIVYANAETDAFGHKKLGGIGEQIGNELKKHSSKYNNGHEINIIHQKLGYLVRSGQPDALDSIIPTTYGNMALDLIKKGVSGCMVCVKDGKFDYVPIETVQKNERGESIKKVNVAKYYDTNRYRPIYQDIIGSPMLFLTKD